ncbi:MAG: hypothetical protein ACJA2S_000503 [Cyclobacteriaceae bacterium]|jgi:hypothetical protein
MKNNDCKVLATEIANGILNNEPNHSKLDHLFSETSVSNENQVILQEEVDEIGVWVKGTGGFYERNVDKIDEWRHWASVPIIESKQANTTRVVLLGESVARGYLFDPYFNLAKAVDAIFKKPLQDKNEFDFVDLARVSIELEELSDLTRQSFKLNPDALVIFAGNNWFNSFRKDLTNEQLEEIDQVINDNFKDTEKEGSYVDDEVFRYIAGFFNNGIEREVIKYLSLLKKLSETYNVPVIFVLPEYNMQDWKVTDYERFMCRKPLSTQIDWLNYKNAATQALLNEDFERAKNMASKMIECDSTHPLGYCFASEAEGKQGDYEIKYRNLAMARDTCVYNRSIGQARILSVIHNTILSQYENYGIHLINLPEIFKGYLNGELPARNLFIDYCHLNEHGLKLVSQAIADKLNEVLPHLKQQSKGIVPDDEVNAAAYLFAAVHNAHYGQRHDILDYLCRVGLDSSIEMAIEFMKCFVDFSTRKSSNIVCRSHENLLEDEILNQYERGMGFIHSANKKIMDVALVKVMVDLLKEEGVDIEEAVESIRKNNHDITGKSIDLLKSYYSKSSYDEALNGGNSFYRTCNLVSEFTFISYANSKLVLELVYRTPGREIEGDEIEVMCNSTQVGRLNQSETWKKVTLEVDNKYVENGINNLKIYWPFRTPIKYTSFKGERVDISSIANKIYKVYGEIHSLKVRGISIRQ